MKDIELDEMEFLCISQHKESLNEEICKGLAFLLKNQGTSESFEEHFPTISKQLRSDNSEFIIGDEIRTDNGMIGFVTKVSGEKPNQKIWIRRSNSPFVEGENYIFINHRVKHLFCTDEFQQLTMDQLPF